MNKKRRNIIICIIVISCMIWLSFAVMVVMGCLFVVAAFIPTTGVPELSCISDRFDIAVFPPSTRLDHSLLRQEWDSHVLLAKLSMRRSDADKFIKGITASGSCRMSREDMYSIRRDKIRSILHIPVPEWWNPDSAGEFIAIEQNSAYKTILIDMDDPERVVIYMVEDYCGG
ncbi:MAG: hypothetical protein ACYC0V_12495 [Armatimonadota bacterium]